MAKKTFILSDESVVNSYGFRVLTSGIDLGRFRKNPVLLFNHKRWGDGYAGPIGRWENIRVENGQLLADAVFDEKDEFAVSIMNKVNDDFIRTASIGILDIIEVSEDAAYMLPGQRGVTVTKCTICEASVCDIPANENAIALYDANGNLIEDTDRITSLLLSLANHHTSNHNQNNSEMKKLAAFATLFGLAADALSTEDQVLERVTILKADLDKATKRIEDLEAKLGDEQKLKVKTMLDAAEEAGKITKTTRPNFESLANLSFEDCKAALDAIQPAKLPIQLVGAPGGAAAGSAAEDRSKWTLAEWHKNDYPGLLKLKEQDPEAYKKLFKN